jgi:hypothetical protein
MRTEALIEFLAQGEQPVRRFVALRAFMLAAAAGLVLSAALAVGMRGPAPGEIYGTAAQWIKLAYAGTLGLAAGWLAIRLALPAARVRIPRRAVTLVATAMATIGIASLLLMPSGTRLAAFLGESWRTCPWNVLVLSLPALAATLWAMRGLAPTRAPVAGFAAGVFAGALGAFGYALSCPETSPAFVAAWYSLGVGLTGLLGAALGPRVLRW